MVYVHTLAQVGELAIWLEILKGKLMVALQLYIGAGLLDYNLGLCFPTINPEGEW